MDKKTLNKILKFQGDLHESYVFVISIINDLGFEISFDPNSVSDPLGSFVNAIRNYRQRNLIHPVVLDGRKLSLNGRNILQYLLIKGLLWQGSNLKRLQAISDLGDKELQRLIMAKEVDINELPEPTKPISTPINRDLKKNQPWHHFKIRNGIMLQIQSGKYDQDQIKRIRETVKSSLEVILR